MTFSTMCPEQQAVLFSGKEQEVDWSSVPINQSIVTVGMLVKLEL